MESLRVSRLIGLPSLDHRPSHLLRQSQRRRSAGFKGSGRRGVLSTFTVAAGEATVDTVVGKTVDAVKFSGDVIKQAIDLLGKVQQVADKVRPSVTDAIDKAAPVAQNVTKSAVDVSSKAITAATPVVKSGIQALSNLLSGQGVDLNAVQSTTQTAVRTASDVATPAVKTSLDFVTTTNPTVLGIEAAGIVGLYFFGPSLLSFLIATTRGYGGDISAAGALDTVMSNGNSFLIDIRTTSEKERTGLPDVPGNIAGQLIAVEFAVTQNRKLRGQMGDPEEVESQVTALQIAALRRLSRSSEIFLLDANGSMSRRVAKKLNGLGFRKCFVVSGGFGGWTRSKLQTKPSPTIYKAEVVEPVTILGTVLGGTTRRKVSTTNRRSLPPGR